MLFSNGQPARRKLRLRERPLFSFLTALALVALPPGAMSARGGIAEQRQGPLAEHLVEEFALGAACSLAARTSFPRRHLDAKLLREDFSHDDRRPRIAPTRALDGPPAEHRGHNGFGGPLLT